MYEFEILYIATNETTFLYGRSPADLARRYPHIDPATYVVINWEYID